MTEPEQPQEKQDMLKTFLSSFTKIEEPDGYIIAVNGKNGFCVYTGGSDLVALGLIDASREQVLKQLRSRIEKVAAKEEDKP